MPRCLPCLVALMFAAPAWAGVVTETYSDRAAFEARLGGAVDVVTFDDVDTSIVDPVAFAADRYAAGQGIVVTGEAGQFASRAFGFPDDYPTSSAPNQYSPGPMESTLGGGNQTDVTFVDASQPAAVAGFGAVFVDPDLDGLSSVTVFDGSGTPLGTVPVPEANEALVFRGIVTVDELTGLPTPAIVRVRLVNGTGWPAGALNDGVPLDDFVFGLPVPFGGTTTTTSTTLLVSTTTTTTLCTVEPVPGCGKPTVSGESRLLLRRKARAAGNRLVWVWGKGAATAKGDFGDPPAATALALCAYDTSGLRLEVSLPPGGTCAGQLCWKTTRNGFVYRDGDLGSDGVGRLRLKAGTGGRARIVLVARGANLPFPQLPLATPLVAQLVRSDGVACWDANFSVARKNSEVRFKARSD